MSGPDARSGRWIGLGLVALALAWFPGVWLGREVLWTHDLRHHHLPWRAWSAAEWAAGRVPLWCPDVGNGFPLMADGQTGVFYLPTQILFLLRPSTGAVGWSGGLHLIWAGLGAAALARAQGRSVGACWIAGDKGGQTREAAGLRLPLTDRPHRRRTRRRIGWSPARRALRRGGRHRAG